MQTKSTTAEIEARFDNEVERFSDLKTGQQTTLDAVFNMDLITDAIARHYPGKVSVLDIGCGAGNYSVKLLSKVKEAELSLADLSMPMLRRAYERTSALQKGTVNIYKGDFRSLDLERASFDVIIATAVLHHLRDDEDWAAAIKKLYDLLRPGGSIWIFDLVHQAKSSLQDLIYRERYGSYLSGLKDDAYRDHVFAYIEQEDSPRSLMYQLELLKKTGFMEVDVLHKNLCFASFVAFK